MKRIFVQPELCSGCRACEVACVMHHDGNFGAAAARIRITKIEHLGLDHPHVCRLCSRASCLEACPTNALYRDPITTAVLLHQEECIGCAECLEACPFGMVELHPETNLIQICNLCDGDPACVSRCATGAIVYAEPRLYTQGRRRALALEELQNRLEGEKPSE